MHGLDGKNVVTLNIVKRAGENLIDAADKIKGSRGRNAETEIAQRSKSCDHR